MSAPGMSMLWNPVSPRDFVSKVSHGIVMFFCTAALIVVGIGWGE